MPQILHTILPNFFVMWDDKIKTLTVGGGRNGRTYSYEFLPKMQQELNEAIESCMSDMKLDRKNAIKYIREHCGYETLAKLADEHNYVKYTLQDRAFQLSQSIIVPSTRACEISIVDLLSFE